MIDTLDNTKIVYLFINKFEWAFSNDKEINLGHPIEGRLYRAVYNKDTDSYRIIYKFGKGHQAFYIDKLQNSDETKGYTSNISPVTLSTILDFDIKQEDLDVLDHWLETDNKELIEELWGEVRAPGGGAVQQVQMKPIGKSELASIFAEFMSDSDPLFSTFMENLHKLRESNPNLVEALSDFINFVLDEKPSNSPIDSYWLNLDKNHGTGANIHSAIDKLARYAGEDRRTNLMKEDLMGAIKNLLTEQVKRNLYES